MTKRYIKAGFALMGAVALCGGAFGAPAILTPPDGSTLAGSSETFTWSADGDVIDRWRLEIGTAPGATDIFGRSLAPTVTAMLVSGLPTDGSAVYVSLRWRVDGVVSAASYVYTASGGTPPANTAPVVDAGGDQAIALPVDTITLNGVVSDDGLPLGSLNLTWSVLSGPDTVSFLDPTAASTTATFVIPGDYVLQLNASDTLLDASDQLTVTVTSEAGTEQSFVAIGDSFVNGAQPSRNFDSNTNVVVHSFGPKVGLVQFDLSSLSGATVGNAEFRFRLNALTAGGTIDLQLISEPWSESTVTFDNQPAFGATVVSVPVTTANVGTVVSLDVTNVVQSWADGSQPGHGFRMQASQGINARIDSAESGGTPMELLVTVDDGMTVVATPSISPNGATSLTPVEVTIATATPGASIYYTLDASTPTTGSNPYSSPFTLAASATVSARAFASGLGDSAVSTAIFAISVPTGGGLNNHWTFNEIATGSYANEAGGAAGACTSCPTPGPGLIAGGQSFDGTSNVIAVADDGSADWSENGGFSLEFWVNKGSACSSREVVVGRFDGGTSMQWAVGCDGGSPYFELVDANGTSVTATANGAMDDGEWHHVVAVHDGFFDEIRLYMDGNLEAAEPAAFASDFGSSADISIGALQNGLANTFLHGTVDEVAFHDRTIPASMISRHYLDGTIGLRRGYVGCNVAVDVMPLGDSNTAALGYRPTLYFDLTGQGYDVNFVGSQSDASSTGSHDRDHEGWSGFTTADIAANLNGWLSGNPPDVILLHIGTNDLDAGTADAAITGLAGILDIVRAFDPEITVVLAQIINRQTFSQETADYNDQMVTLVQTKAAAGHKILLVDHENALTYPDDMANLKHANGFGYAKMAGVWFDGVTDFLPICDAAAPFFKSVAGSTGQSGFEYRYEPVVLASPPGRFTLLTAPAGLRLHPDTGEIRWIAGSSGQYNVDIQVQNANGSAVQSLILQIP